jgi:hypothetical protein
MLLTNLALTKMCEVVADFDRGRYANTNMVFIQMLSVHILPNRNVCAEWSRGQVQSDRVPTKHA